jgi:hypothetical protein
MTDSEAMHEALAAASDGVRRATDLMDVMAAISAAATLAGEALQEIEDDLLRVVDIIGRSEP